MQKIKMNLCDQYKLMHEQGAFKGYSLLPHVDDIAKLVKKYNAKTLLDYGCGKGLQYTEKNAHEAWGGIMPTLYDPHVEEYSIEPDYEVQEFDGLICTDVMEHLETEEEAINLLDYIFAVPDKFLFVTICTRDAKKKLPDGRNCHTLVRPDVWWMDRIEEIEAESSNEWSYKNSLWTNRPHPHWYVKFVE